MGFERLFNPSLQSKPESTWVENLLHEMPLSPPYFKRMKHVNKVGADIVGPVLPGQKRWSAPAVQQRTCEDCLIVDVRAKESFAAAHIPGAINIPFGNNLPTWAGWVLPYDRPILLMVDQASQVESVVTNLLRVGFDDIQGFVDGGINAWETAGFPLERLNTASVHQLQQLRQNEKRLVVVDVRTESEWNAGHIEDALHIHGGTLPDRVEEIPADRPVAVVCGSGYRASIASSFLRREGFEDVTNVLGGMSAWKAADLPVTN